MTVTHVTTEAEKKFCEFKLNMTGSFYTSLITTIFKADEGNRKKLALAFPELVEVVNNYNYKTGYWENLVERWNSYSPHHLQY